MIYALIYWLSNYRVKDLFIHQKTFWPNFSSWKAPNSQKKSQCFDWKSLKTSQVGCFSWIHGVHQCLEYLEDLRPWVLKRMLVLLDWDSFLSPSGDLGIGLVWDNPTGPHHHILVRLLKSTSNWTKSSMIGPQLFLGWYQMIFRCSD